MGKKIKSNMLNPDCMDRTTYIFSFWPINTKIFKNAAKWDNVNSEGASEKKTLTDPKVETALEKMLRTT